MALHACKSLADVEWCCGWSTCQAKAPGRFIYHEEAFRQHHLRARASQPADEDSSISFAILWNQQEMTKAHSPLPCPFITLQV